MTMRTARRPSHASMQAFAHLALYALGEAFGSRWSSQRRTLERGKSVLTRYGRSDADWDSDLARLKAEHVRRAKRRARKPRSARRVAVPA